MDRTLAFLTTVVLALSPLAATSLHAGETIVGLTTQNGIEIIDSNSPGSSLSAGFVGGIEPGELLLGIDYRPATGAVYVIGNQDNVYTVNLETFDATLIGTFAPPRLSGNSFGFDFNPAFMGGEFARIISNTDQNRVISGNNGAYLLPVERTQVFYADGDPNFNADPNIAGIAYTNNVRGSASTLQYGIDASLGILTTVANNAGTLQTVGSLGVSPLTNELGFDISGDTGTAYASLQSGGSSQLYTINLVNGQATALGIIGSNDTIRDITVVPAAIPEPSSIALLGSFAVAGLTRRRRR